MTSTIHAAMRAVISHTESASQLLASAGRGGDDALALVRDARATLDLADIEVGRGLAATSNTMDMTELLGAGAGISDAMRSLDALIDGGGDIFTSTFGANQFLGAARHHARQLLWDAPVGA